MRGKSTNPVEPSRPQESVSRVGLRMAIAIDKAQQDRKSRAREAQRRWRQKQLREELQKQARAAQIETAANGMLAAFLSLSDSLIDSEVLSDKPALMNSFKNTTTRFRQLAMEINGDEESATEEVDVHSPADDPASRHLAEPGAVATEAPFLRTLPQEQAMLRRTFTPRAPEFPLYPEVAMTPSSYMKYCTADRLDSTGFSFSRKLAYCAAMATIKYLSASDLKSAPTAWIARSHRLTLKHATKTELVVLTSYVLQTFVDHVQQQPSDAAWRGPADPFQDKPQRSTNECHLGPRMRELGQAVRSELSQLGLSRDDFATFEEVEDYLILKGMTVCNDERIEIRVKEPSTNDGAAAGQPELNASGYPRTLILDTEKLILALMHEMMCLGDGGGFPWRYLNAAIAYATIGLA